MVYPHTYRMEHSETRTTNATYGQYYAHEQSKKIAIQPVLLKLLQYVDSRRVEFISDLDDIIKIKSVSSSLDHMDDVIQMVKFIEEWMIKLGIKYECFNIGFRELDGKKVRRPPVILASIGRDARKKTLCIYSYLDVPLADESKWSTDPWKVTEMDKVLVGNGVASGKSALLCWLHAIAGILTTTELPVNIKFIIESMHHERSEGLDDFLMTKKLDFLSGIDYVVTCDSEWIGEKHPCIIYGAVGLIHGLVTVEKTEESTTEPKDDIERLFETFRDDRGHISIDEFSDTVKQITPDEEILYENIQDFDPIDIQESLEPYMREWDKVKLLMHFWRLPSIYIDDTLLCNCKKQDFSKVKKEFILKIVPNQAVERIIAITDRHITKTVEQLEIKNDVQLEIMSTTRPWLENIRTPNFEAARRATIQIYKEDPNMIRDDRTYLILDILNKNIEKPILLMPLGNKSIHAGKENENIPIRNYYEGTKLLAAYLFQLALVKSKPERNA